MTFYKGQKFKRPIRRKHKWAQGTIRTEPSQRKALLAIRKLLAGQGYQIYPVATWFRRSSHDFLAVPRQNPNRLLLIRPTHRRATEILYYAFRDSYHHIKTYLDAHEKECGKMVWGRQLPAKDPSCDWLTFVSRNCMRELVLFTNANPKEAKPTRF